MRFDYLLWDFDGTLFDTYPPLVRAIEQALAEYGHTAPAARIRALLTDTLASTLDTLSAEPGIARDDLAARVTHYRDLDEAPETCPPFPGVIALCERFMAAGGAHLLFTHRDRPTLDRLLAYHGADHLFLDILTSDEGYPRKPDAAGFRALIERNRLPRDRVLAVGDRDLDILAGKGAGIATCLYDATPSPAAPPDFCIASWDELATLIGLPATPETDSDADLTRR